MVRSLMSGISRSPIFAAAAAFSALTATAHVMPSAANASTTFSLTNPTAINPVSPKEISVDNILLTLSDPLGSNQPNPPTININSSGLCAFTEVGSSGGRCGYLPGTGTILNGFSLTFDKSVFLRQFDIAGIQNISSGSISFSGAPNQPFNLTSNGTQTFSSPFLVSAGSTISVTTSGTFLPGFNSGVFRIANLQVDLAPEASVPGPLPIFGAGVAFAYSRRVRARILKKAS